MKTSWLKWLIALPLLAYSALLLVLFLFQERLIFPGTPLAEDHTFHFNQPFTEVRVPVEGAVLHGLHFQQSKPRGLVFHLHGNAANVQRWTRDADFYQKVNYDLFIFDYRGYGKSTGRITSQKQLSQDVLTAWQQVASEYEGLPIVIYGHSLGTALAVDLARKVSHEKVVLVAPFTSMEAMAKQQYPYVPSQLVRYPLRTDRIIGEIETPITLFHGDQDSLIPLSHSQTLSQLVTNLEQLYVIEGAGHRDILEAEPYLEAFAELLP